MSKGTEVVACVQKARESLRRATSAAKIEARVGHLWEAINHLAAAVEAEHIEQEDPDYRHLPTEGV